MTDRPTDNSAQATFWTDQAGPAWVAAQDRMDATLAPVLGALLNRAALQQGERVLDIGCGAGVSTLAAARAVGSAGAVTGVDISATLLERARATATASGATFLRADAQTHLFEQGHDALISRFGVMFFADTTAAFANLARAMRPGGRMVCAAWAHPAKNPFFTVPARAAKEVLGPQPPTDRTLPGPFAWEETDRIVGLLSAAGWRDVAATPAALQLTPPGNAAETAKLLCEIGPAQSALRRAEASQPQAEALCAVLKEMLSEFAGTGGLRIPAEVTLFTGITTG